MTVSDRGVGLDLDAIVQVPASSEEAAALLTSWRCCGAPSVCGARCMDDEDSHRLAQFAAFIDNERANNSGLVAEVRRLRATLSEIANLAHCGLTDEHECCTHSGLIEGYGCEDCRNTGHAHPPCDDGQFAAAVLRLTEGLSS